MNPVIERIAARWDSEASTIGGLRPGATPEAFTAFEARHGVIIPPSMRDMYAVADGMNEDADDDRCFHLDSLDSIVPARDFWPDGPPWVDQWFLFASFLINSHCYVVRLSPTPGDPGPVATWGYGEGPRDPVASSFAGFLEIYSRVDGTDDTFGPRELFGGGESMSEDSEAIR